MSFWGLTFVTLHGSSCLPLYPGLKIVATSKVLFPLFYGRSLALEEALDWLQFIFTEDRTGYYVSPVFTFLFQYMMTEVVLIFAPVLEHFR